MRAHLLRRTVVVGSARRASARLAVGAAVAVAAVTLASCSAADPSPSPSASSIQTSPVTRGDLAESMSFAGVLTYDHPFDAVFQKTVTTTTTTSTGGGGFGGRGGGAAVAVTTKTTTVTTAASGTITWVAPAASVLKSGDVLYRVDNVPVILLEGEEVLWRDLKVGSTGDDVQAIEGALSALGYDPNGTVTVDQKFTSLSRAMTQRFEAAYGLAKTTTFPYATVVMRPGDAIVTNIALGVGDAVTTGDTVMTISDTSRVVNFSLAPADRNKLALGDAVTMRLSTGKNVSGTIASISSGLDATTSEYDVVAAVSDPIEGLGDKVDVTVKASVPLATGALLVPSTALVVRDDGTTTVRVVKDGVMTTVVVTVIATAGQNSAVSSSDLAEGDTVVTT
jgi:peptidoglycan hydrolase-like protein with peptidoglycan-binding domain